LGDWVGIERRGQERVRNEIGGDALKIVRQEEQEH